MGRAPERVLPSGEERVRIGAGGEARDPGRGKHFYYPPRPERIPWDGSFCDHVGEGSRGE